MRNGETIMKILYLTAALTLAAALGACHHNDHDKPPPVADTPTPTATDAFFTYVSQVVAGLSETEEPASVDGVALTSPDGTEPQPVPGS
jgi:hypothetical protein